MGIIVNFTPGAIPARGMLKGFTRPGYGDVVGPPVKIPSFPVQIILVSETIISFHGSSGSKDETISGTLDRLTGEMNATWSWWNKNKALFDLRYSLKCKPTQRMF